MGRSSYQSRTNHVQIVAKALVEILGEGSPHRLGHCRHMTVIRVVEADGDLGARLLERGDLLRREPEADELDRRGLALGAGILARRVRLAADPLAGDLDEGVA